MADSSLLSPLQLKEAKTLVERGFALVNTRCADLLSHIEALRKIQRDFMAEFVAQQKSLEAQQKRIEELERQVLLEQSGRLIDKVWPSDD